MPYDRIRRADPAKARLCEQCHNPMRFVLEAGDPRASIFAQEGVTCDFCHSVAAVSLEGPFPRYKTSPGTRFGPKGGRPGKTYHRVRFSGLHLTSRFCAGCHEFRNQFGVKILSTMSEWEESFYRGEGIHCQFCHLPQLYDARFIEAKKPAGPPDHAMVGGHSRERLTRAIAVRARLSRGRGEARLTAWVRNETVGHKIPSGIPRHRLRLTGTLFDAEGRALDSKEEVFERILGDGTGRPLERPELVYTGAREVLKDNQIAPKETRRIEFVFPVRGAAPAFARVALVYELPTPDIAPATRYIEIPVSEVVVPAKPTFPPLALALAAFALAAVLFAATLVLKRAARP